MSFLPFTFNINFGHIEITADTPLLQQLRTERNHYATRERIVQITCTHILYHWRYIHHQNHLSPTHQLQPPPHTRRRRLLPFIPSRWYWSPPLPTTQTNLHITAPTAGHSNTLPLNLHIYTRRYHSYFQQHWNWVCSTRQPHNIQILLPVFQVWSTERHPQSHFSPQWNSRVTLFLSFFIKLYIKLLASVKCETSIGNFAMESKLVPQSPGHLLIYNSFLQPSAIVVSFTFCKYLLNFQFVC